MGLFDILKPRNEIERLLDEAKKVKKQNTKDALYQFEHHNFRKLFYDEEVKTVEALINKKGFIYCVYLKHCELMGQTSKYSEEQFVLKAYANDRNQIVFILTPPEPYRAPLCYQIYLLVDSDGKPNTYYTLEKDLVSTPVLCSWGHEGTHYNYGSKNINDLCGPFVKELDIDSANSFSALLTQTNTIEQETKKESTEEETKNDCVIGKSDTRNSDDDIQFCKNCGEKLLEDEIFCHKCGTKIR